MVDIANKEIWKEIDADNINGTPSFPPGMPVDLLDDNMRASQGAIARWFARTNPTVRSSGSENAQVLEYTVSPLANTIGDMYRFTAGFSNTGPCSLDVGTGPISLVVHGQGLVGGEILEDTIAVVAFNSAGNFELLNPQGRVVGDLAVTGDAAITGNLDAFDITSHGDVTVGDACNVNGPLSVSGLANFATDAAVGGNFNVVGSTALNDTTIDGVLTLTDGTIIVNGHPVNLLSADKFYYISTTGSDSSGDGSIDAPWASLSHAAAAVQATTNFGGFRVSLLLEPGLYSSTSTAFAPSVGNWEIVSSTLNANDVHIECSGVQQDGIHPIGNAQVFCTEITCGATGGFAFCSSGASYLTLGHVIVTTSVGHIAAFDGGSVQCNENITLAGGAQMCLFVEHATLVASSSGTPVTFTATGAVPFSNAFAVCAGGGYLRAVSGTFSSITATGVRYVVSSNAVIMTGGESEATYFPGSTAGSASTGGVWV